MVVNVCELHPVTKEYGQIVGGLTNFLEHFPVDTFNMIGHLHVVR